MIFVEAYLLIYCINAITWPFDKHFPFATVDPGGQECTLGIFGAIVAIVLLGVIGNVSFPVLGTVGNVSFPVLVGNVDCPVLGKVGCGGKGPPFTTLVTEFVTFFVLVMEHV